MGKFQGLDPAQFFRFKKRDHAIFDQVYAMYHRVCYVVIYSILKHHETSEDVLQDVFLKAYEISRDLSSGPEDFFNTSKEKADALD